MSDIIISSLLENAVWSHSKIMCYEICPYRFYLRYIRETETKGRFYATYGLFIHKLLQQYYTGKIEKDELAFAFLKGFKKNVIGTCPNQSTFGVYLNDGINYFNKFKPFEYQTLAVEKQVNFKIGGNRFVGVIDYLGEDENGLIIVDHKSSKLKPLSNRKKKTKNDLRVEETMRQLYLYSEAVRQEYGKYPCKLQLNCFRNRQQIIIPFNAEDFDKTIEWYNKEIDYIKHMDDFTPIIDNFCCNYICDVTDECIYAEEYFKQIN